MRNLPVQSVPVQRSRVTRGPQLTSGGVCPSVCLGIGPAQICIGPFVSEGDSGVTQSVCVGPVCVGPFAD